MEFQERKDMAKKKLKKTAPCDEEDLSFESSLAELEQIVADLEEGELGLTDALARYEEGVRHLKNCHAQLARVERKIELLSGVDASGRPITVPLDEDAEESVTAMAATRGRRRSRPLGTAGGANSAADGEVDSLDRLF
jgi:exodeoxyribonuclease VII small subunit